MNSRKTWLWGAVALTTAGAGYAVESSPGPVAVLPSFAVHSGRSSRPSHYIPSGYMGDINNLSVSGSYTPTHDGTGTPLKVEYRAKGPKGWAGLYWQHPANNWGERAGQTGYDLRGAKSLVFWARGEKGGEKIHEVRVGGIVGTYPDSDVASRGPIQLTKEWQRFEIEVSNKDLRHIIGGFCFLVNKRDNSGDIVFYIDDVGFEMAQTPALPSAAGTIVESTPVAKGVMTAPVSPSKDIQIKTDESGLRVSFSSQFLFASGQTVLQTESGKILKQVIEILRAYPKNDVLVEGHTDNTGGADYNLTLSRLRAEHVRDYFIKEGGFEASRFRVVGYGQTHPNGDNATRSGRALNRRVEVIILKAAD